MTIERFPADLPITKADFVECGWRDALASKGCAGYRDMHLGLTEAAERAINEGRISHGKVLWLLADACSMRLNPEKVGDPFSPLATFGNRRSPLPIDFSDTDLNFFEEIVEEIDEPWLQARIADILWTVRRKLGTRMACIALDAYREIPLNRDTWIHDGDKCWMRAMRFASMRLVGTEDRVKEMETAILASFNRSKVGDGYLALWMAKLLLDNGLGRTDGETITEHLVALANAFEARKELRQAQAYFDHCGRWFKELGNDTKAVEMTVRVAETWVKLAEERIVSENPSHLAAASFFESAIQIYRTIPHASRPQHQVNERLEELRLRMAESGERSLGEMVRVSSEPIDISKLIDAARESVSGKNPLDALKSFANHTRGVSFKQLESDATKALNDSPLRALFPSNHLAVDGRVIARNDGSSPTEGSSAKPGTALWEQMIHLYMLHVSLMVQGEIMPALEILNFEHHFVRDVFVQIAHNSPIIPPGREGLWGTALQSGFDGDFGTAVHLVSPQIEGMVRFHLKNAGVKTTTLGKDGIENEIGLSKLVELPEVEKIFGEDLTFELRVLFCDATGPNLRNEVAHGMLDDNIFRSGMAIYAWWLALKLTFNSFWNAYRKPRTSTEEVPEESDSGGATSA